MLTEHRHFDASVQYAALAEQYEAVVLRGAEVETTVGHVLVYGVSEQFARQFDLTDVALPAAEVFRCARETGGFAVAAHAGRPSIGIAEHVAKGHSLEHVEAVEALNGGSSDIENNRGRELAEQHGLHRVGGSDAHYVSAIGRCMTAFARPVTSIEALVEQLAAGDYYPVTIEETLERETI
ncbi:MAG: PHP domain-containing protein [Chloroflexi bacterium]|nr:PHP domain-containing protein [Chloroflexota bacterium]